MAVEPGILHAHGQLHEVHKVSYSIGLAGEYLLHVRLRQQAMPIPGSPFFLTVTPGGAHGHSTRLPSGATRGNVGLQPEDGCEMHLVTADKMGNRCIEGGAALEVLVEQVRESEAKGTGSSPKGADAKNKPERAADRMEHSESNVGTDVEDHHDGTYTIRWRSKYSGTFRSVRARARVCVGAWVCHGHIAARARVWRGVCVRRWRLVACGQPRVCGRVCGDLVARLAACGGCWCTAMACFCSSPTRELAVLRRRERR